MKSYEVFKNVLKESEERKKSIEESIQKHKNDLAKLEEEYNQAVLKSDDKKADELFSKIEQTKTAIKSSQRKLEVLDKNKTNENIIAAAIEVVKEVQKEQKRVQEEVNQKISELEPIKEKLFNKLFEIGKAQQQDDPLIKIAEEVLKYIPDARRKEFITMTADGGYFYNGHRGSSVNHGSLPEINLHMMLAKIHEGRNAK